MSTVTTIAGTAEVPFFRISSDSHGHQVNPAYRTGFRMLEGLADWMGIRVSNENIRHSPEFWSEGSDTKIRVFGDRRYKRTPRRPRNPIQKQVKQEPERRELLSGSLAIRRIAGA